jgi:hypothetical protein
VCRYSAGGGASYLLDTTARGYEEAEVACNAAGGHLVSYATVGAPAARMPPAAASSARARDLATCGRAAGRQTTRPAAARGQAPLLAGRASQSCGLRALRATATAPLQRDSAARAAVERRSRPGSSAARRPGRHRAPLQDAEQLEVEGFMASRGYLLPGFPTFYWLGLRLLDLPWPNFAWLDPALPAPAVRGGSGGPGHWGTVGVEERAAGAGPLCWGAGQCWPWGPDARAAGPPDACPAPAQVSLDNGQVKVPEPNADYFGRDEACAGGCRPHRRSAC